MEPTHRLSTSVARTLFIVLLGLATIAASAMVAGAEGAPYVDPEIAAGSEGSVPGAESRRDDAADGG